MEKIFEHNFNQLATFENGRTPIHLTEEQYNRAKECEDACEGIENPADLRRQRDELIEAIKESLVTDDTDGGVSILESALEKCRVTI